jgi:hypothetical protein
LYDARVWRARIAAALVVLAIGRTASADPPLVRVHVDMSSEAARPVEIHVADRTAVAVQVTKNAFQSCTVTSTVEKLPEPPDPVAEVLSVLSGIPGLPTAARPGAAPAPAPPHGCEPLHHQLNDLLRELSELNADLDDQLVQIRERAASLPRWGACDRTPVCSDAAAAQAKLEQLAAAIRRTPSHPVASMTVAAARAAELLKALNAKIDEPADDDGAWLRTAFVRLREAMELIDAANERRQLAIKGRESLVAVRERILAYRASTHVEQPLPPLANARATVTIACTNVVTQQPVIYATDATDHIVTTPAPSRSATVVYRSRPAAGVSAGVLYSSVDRRRIGIAAHRVGVDDGVVIYQRRVVESSVAAGQFVPFSFVHLNAPGFRSRRVAPAVSVGVGLNPNNGDTVAEYFAGGALALGRALTLQVGWHVGSRLEPAEQFALGDSVPDRLAAVPTTRRRATGLAVGVGYALPWPR